MQNDAPHFLSINRDALAQIPECKGYRGAQIVDWIYKKKVASPDGMSNLSKPLRTSLLENFSWQLPEVVSRLDSVDGASKLLLKAASGHLIESVILRYENRTSLCVSSQVGCKFACTFCQTGKLGFVRSLSAAEILAQYFIAESMVTGEGRRISHVVFMGMGEPLDNFEATVQAVSTLINSEYFGLSRRHVTVSTSGVVPKIIELADRIQPALAISLHAATDDLRSEIMPINRRYPLAELKKALLYFQTKTGLKTTIEYILIKDTNCSMTQAKELVHFLHGLRAKVNLIPFNPHPGLGYDRPTDSEVRNFQKYLSDRSIAAPVRYSKGLEVSGGCGQLAAKVIAQSQPLRGNVLPPKPAALSAPIH